MNINIPPRTQSYEVTGLCSHDIFTDLCLQPNETLEIFVYSPHAHFLGRQVWGDIIRGGEVIRQIGRIFSEKNLFVGNWNFAFNEQSIYNLESSILLQPGDEIRTHCVYNSMERNTTTRYGESSRAEMCFMFWMYAREEVLPIDCAYCIGYQT